MSKKLYRQTMANFALYLTAGDVLIAIDRVCDRSDTVAYTDLVETLRVVVLKTPQLYQRLLQRLHSLLQQMALAGFIQIEWGQQFSSILRVSLTSQSEPALRSAARYSQLASL